MDMRNPINPIPTKLIPLTSAKLGQRVRVAQVDGGHELRSRLCAMGLTPGTPVQVVCDSGGPVVLDVLGGRLVLGQGMVSKILVRET